LNHCWPRKKPTKPKPTNFISGLSFAFDDEEWEKWCSWDWRAESTAAVSVQSAANISTIVRIYLMIMNCWCHSAAISPSWNNHWRHSWLRQSWIIAGAIPPRLRHHEIITGITGAYWHHFATSPSCVWGFFAMRILFYFSLFTNWGCSGRCDGVRHSALNSQQPSILVIIL